MTPEPQWLQKACGGSPLRRWGPYLSERQWGTAEDYSEDGDPWSYCSHDQVCALPGAGRGREQ